MRRTADAPANDLASIGIDDKGDIDEPLPGGDIGEIRYAAGTQVLCGLRHLLYSEGLALETLSDIGV